MFDGHVRSLCKKSSQKLNVLSRVAYQLDFNQRKLLLNAFITSQFSYAPVVWMFHSRKQNHHINRIHERALRVVYKDYNSSFDELLEKDNSCKIHVSCDKLMNDSYDYFARGTSFRVFQGSRICNWDYCYYTLFICINVTIRLCATPWHRR